MTKPSQTIVIGDGQDNAAGLAGPGFQLGTFMPVPITEPRRHRGGLTVGWGVGHARWHMGTELKSPWLRVKQ